jgi:hypothetical protein
MAVNRELVLSPSLKSLLLLVIRHNQHNLSIDAPQLRVLLRSTLKYFLAVRRFLGHFFCADFLSVSQTHHWMAAY